VAYIAYKLPFDAISQFSLEEKKIAKPLLEILIQ